MVFKKTDKIAYEKCYTRTKYKREKIMPIILNISK